MEFKGFYIEIQDTLVDLLHQDESVHQPSTLSDLLGRSTCMDVDVDSVEAELNVYKRLHQVPLDTDPLMWWKKHVQEFPHLVRMVSQYLVVPATSASPERLFISVGLVKSDLWPHTHPDIHTLTIVSRTHTLHCHWHPPAYRSWLVHLHDLIGSYLDQPYRLSILIDKPTLFINSWLIRLSVDNVLLINTRNLSIVIDKPIPLSIGISTLSFRF